MQYHQIGVFVCTVNESVCYVNNFDFVAQQSFIFSFSDSQDKRIVVENPVVDLDGDEMTRIIWEKIKTDVKLRVLTKIIDIFFLIVKLIFIKILCTVDLPICQN